MREVDSGSCNTAHHNQRWRLDIELGSGGSLPDVLGRRRPIAGVEYTAPTLSPDFSWQHKVHRFPMSIKDQIEGLIEDATAGRVNPGDFVAVEEHAQRFRETGAPVLVGHLFSIGTKPRQIVNVAAANRFSLEPFAPEKYRVLLAELDDLLGEIQLLEIHIFPIHPRNLVVVAVRVVIAPLGATEFVAGEQHRDAQRQEQRRDEIALLTRAQHADLALVAGRAFNPAVPRSIVGLPVAILL